MPDNLLIEIAKHFTNQEALKDVVQRSQPTVSAYVKGKTRVPAEVCMRIDVASGGKFPAETIRPDLAEDFASWLRARASGLPKKARAAA